MNTNYFDVYIEDFITRPLTLFLEGKKTVKDLHWDDMRHIVYECHRLGSAHMGVLHYKMIPFYKLYLFADSRFFKDNCNQVRLLMEELTGFDNDFLIWASNQDLVAATEGWGEYMKRTNRDHVNFYFSLLENFVSSHFHKDWGPVTAELEDLLFHAEVYSDYRTDELLCILHATSRIMQQEWPIEKKNDLFVLLREHWNFMKNIYSLMLRHIIGCKLANFSALTNSLMQARDNGPHLEIYYCVLADRMESLGLTLKQYKSLDDKCQKLLQMVKSSKSSEILYELCNILFPEDFQYMLDNHRPKSYEQLNEERNQFKQQWELLQKEMDRQAVEAQCKIESLASQLKMAIEASIPIGEITESFNRFPPSIAYAIFGQMSQLMMGHPVWERYKLAIQQKILERFQSENSRISIQENHAPIIQMEQHNQQQNTDYNITMTGSNATYNEIK